MPKDQKVLHDFNSLLDESVNIHGHLCPGQVLGVRMSMLGLEKIGIQDPKGEDRKKLIVYVEIDRCATDAVQSVTGCSPGKRTLKLLDFGKMAATFVNLSNGDAVRIFAKEESRESSKDYCPEVEDKYLRQAEAYKIMPLDELFDVQKVRVKVPDHDMPGRPVSRVTCDTCGEAVQDKREVKLCEKVLCKPCARGPYYSK